MEKFEMANPQ